MRTHSPVLPTLPANLSDQVRIALIDRSGQLLLRDLKDDLDAEVLVAARASRRFPGYRGKRNYNGSYWSRTTRTLIGFESLLEREAIMLLDFDPTVAVIVAQPFALLWPKSASHHFPDLLVRHVDGSIAVVDVRALPLLDGKATRQFDLTRRALTHVGWGYTVYTGSAEPLAQNLTFLAGFRKHGFDPEPRLVAALHAAFDPPARLDAGIAAAAAITKRDDRLIRTGALSMLWTHQLHADLTSASLSDASVVWT